MDPLALAPQAALIVAVLAYVIFDDWRWHRAMSEQQRADAEDALAVGDYPALPSELRSRAP